MIFKPIRSEIRLVALQYFSGMQGYPLTNGEDRGLPITEKILPQYLKERGYATHLVGKWHVGHSRVEYLPTNRGFDSHFGHRGGYLDYYEYVLQENVSKNLDLLPQAVPICNKKYIGILRRFVRYVLGKHRKTRYPRNETYYS